MLNPNGTRPFSEMLVNRKADADRVARRMREQGVVVRQYSEGRGLHWLQFEGDDHAECQSHWEDARAHYFDRGA